VFDSLANKMVQVVVIGFGYGGLFATKQLESKGVDVVVIERNECFFHKIGGAKACIVPGYEELAIIPFDKVFQLPNSRLIGGSATQINDGEVIVELRDGGEEVVPFDHLIIATGLVHGFGQMPEAALSEKEMFDFCKAEQERVKNASSIKIIGGGALGAEASTQILETHPNTKVSLIHSRNKLLNSATPPVSDDFSALLAEKLTAHEVDLQLGAGRQPEEEELPEGEVKIWATGCKPSPAAQTLFGDWLDKDTGELRVNDQLQVVGAPGNVYAIGDVAATGDYKQAKWSYSHAEVAVKNILEAASPPATYKPSTSTSFKMRLMSFAMFPMVKKRVGTLATVKLYLGSKDCIAEFGGVLWNDKLTSKMVHADKGANKFRNMLHQPILSPDAGKREADAKSSDPAEPQAPIEASTA